MAEDGKPTKIGDFTVYDLESTDECDHEPKHDAILMGHFYVGGCRMYAYFLRVETDEDGDSLNGEQVPVCDPHDRLRDLLHLDDINFCEFEIPGHEGLWIFYAHGGER